MKAPAFWFKKQSLLQVLLSPIAMIYGQATQTRANKPPKWRAPVPVICVGNVALGGTGKTPTVQAIASFYISIGKRPFILSRGYGGHMKGPVLVGDHSAFDVGDEPKLLAQTCSVCVSQDRVAGAQHCVEQGAEVIIMDDGLQNPDLFKDYSFIVIDGTVGQGNGSIFPAGPLRETLSNGLKRAQAIIMIGSDNTKENVSVPVLEACVKPTDPNYKSDGKFVAFAGIGRPEKFFNLLRQNKFQLAGTFEFPDHHLYSVQDMNELKNSASQHKAQLICTEKDWVKLPETLQKEILPYKITLEWRDEDLLKAILSEIIKLS